MRIAMWTLVSFLSGSIMYSYMIGKFLHVDIRTLGDRNPGAGNLTLTGHFWLAMVGALLDFAKALIPVALAARIYGQTSWAMVPIGIAPILGHAYSPWLRFRGGKSLACAFGVWLALTGAVGVVSLGIGVAGTHWLVDLDNEGWSIATGMTLLLAALLVFAPAPSFLTLWALNLAVFAQRYRNDLGRRPQPRFAFARHPR